MTSPRCAENSAPKTVKPLRPQRITCLGTLISNAGGFRVYSRETRESAHPQTRILGFGRSRTSDMLRSRRVALGQVGVHEALEESPMIGDKQMEQLVGDDLVLEGDGLGQQVGAEINSASGGARGPFIAHSLDVNPLRLDTDLSRPAAHPLLEQWPRDRLASWCRDHLLRSLMICSAISFMRSRPTAGRSSL